MPLQFNPVTRQNPCPICLRTDWCEFGDRAVHCMRVESDHPAKDGGWYHHYEKTGYRPPVVARKVEKPRIEIDCAGTMRNWLRQTTLSQFQECAEQLNVLKEALMALQAAYAPEYRAWAFPMYDGAGKMIGIRLRNKESFKWAVAGSRQGIFAPSVLVKVPDLIFLPEGPTDTAALLSMGFYAIGRPTNLGGVEMIKEMLKRIQRFRVVIVSDNDERKRFGDGEKRPGLTGALSLKRQLGLSSIIWMPFSPLKDVRQFLKEGGTAQIIQDDIGNSIWTKG